MNKKIALPVILVLCIAIGLIFAVGCTRAEFEESTSTEAPIPAPAAEPASAPKTTPNVIQQKVETMGGSFTEDLEVINSQAERLGIEIQAITHGGGSITFACRADSHTAFRNYLDALDESGRFSSVSSPAYLFPDVKSGTLTLEPKFQRDISGIYYNNLALAPMTDQAAIDVLVSIAEESGINIDPDAGKLRVPSASFSQTQVDEGKYRLLSFRNIYVQGDHDNVMAFISDLESGKVLKTMGLNRVTIADGFEVDGKIETRATVDVDIYTKSQ